ncbi:hypothetical protein LTR37_013648 [Vermiconidia calcicola]|uniref:Uncharacterized protein n=1 Tax=Vermiconidia calcicola TaxID=1690605 RepID=A0ACC3MW06_9PEZI|nr:hypothetical protein LTR37_013648 [Vermiconidia calcicola]
MTRPRVYLDVNIGNEPAGRLTVELFTDKTPKTCENFRQLCTGEHDGLSYAKSPFHRVIDEFMVQGGDIEKGDGTGTISIYGAEYEDENLRWREADASGLVCSANRGPDTNGSQFFITLEGEPEPHLSTKHTIFARLVSGEDTLQKIANVDTDKGDRPLEPVLIARCGELEKRGKKASRAPAVVQQSESGDRGRRRRSNEDEDVKMESSPERPAQHQHRRHSDKAVDEGIRGRPRQRSNSRSSPSRPLSVQHEEEDDGSGNNSASPPRKHKRKRSQSPSRHAEGAGYERRRRSLPNQYKDEGFSRAGEDETRFKPSPRRDDSHRSLGRRHGERDRGDRYRPSQDEGRLGDGRLGGVGGYDDYEAPVKFKGRGVMKYREPGRL